MQARHVTGIAAALLVASLSAFAGTDTQGTHPLTRDEVRAELAMARAQGMLDVPGELGATDAVLLAREHYNQTQTRVLIARYELQRERAEQERLAQAQPAEVVLIVEPDFSGTVALVEMIDVD